MVPSRYNGTPMQSTRSLLNVMPTSTTSVRSSAAPNITMAAANTPRLGIARPNYPGQSITENISVPSSDASHASGQTHVHPIPTVQPASQPVPMHQNIIPQGPVHTPYPYAPFPSHGLYQYPMSSGGHHGQFYQTPMYVQPYYLPAPPPPPPTSQMFFAPTVHEQSGQPTDDDMTTSVASITTHRAEFSDTVEANSSVPNQEPVI
jgi:hypothetical protein